LGKALCGPKRAHLWKTEPGYEVMNISPRENTTDRGDKAAASEDIKHCIGRNRRSQTWSELWGGNLLFRYLINSQR